MILSRLTVRKTKFKEIIIKDVFTIAVIGCGAIARGSHFPAFEKLGNIRVKYACDLIIEKAEALKAQYSFV